MMQVITKYPIYQGVDGGFVVNTIIDGYSGMDASSPFQDILNFQSWANRWKGTNLTVDGIYGPKSKAAYAKYGAEFERSKADPTYVPKKVSAPAVSTSTGKTGASQKPVEEKKEKAAEPSNTASGKSKPKLSKTTKIALAVSAVVLAVVVIRIVQKAVKK